MFEAASIACAYAGFACLHAFWARTSPARRRSRGQKIGALVASLILFSCAIWLWDRIDPSPGAWLGVAAASQLVAMFVALVAPLAPRLVWSLALISLPIAGLFALFGARG